MKLRILLIAAAAVVVAAGSAIATAAITSGNDAPSAAEVEAVRTNLQKKASTTANAGVETALAAMKPMLVDTCWTPNASGDGPASVVVDANMTVLADGTIGALGVSERREASRAGVANCVQSQLLAMKVAPPNSAVQVETSIALP